MVSSTTELDMDDSLDTTSWFPEYSSFWVLYENHSMIRNQSSLPILSKRIKDIWKLEFDSHVTSYSKDSNIQIFGIYFLIVKTNYDFFYRYFPIIKEIPEDAH